MGKANVGLGNAVRALVVLPSESRPKNHAKCKSIEKSSLFRAKEIVPKRPKFS
jgi:hypothetical protein